MRPCVACAGQRALKYAPPSPSRLLKIDAFPDSFAFEHHSPVSRKCGKLVRYPCVWRYANFDWLGNTFRSEESRFAEGHGCARSGGKKTPSGKKGGRVSLPTAHRPTLLSLESGTHSSIFSRIEPSQPSSHQTIRVTFATGHTGCWLHTLYWTHSRYWLHTLPTPHFACYLLTHRTHRIC